MITAEERESIITEAIERALLAIPEVIGNLIASHVALTKSNKKFYEDHPELADKKSMVASVIEMVDGDNPGIDYEKLLEKSLPEIRKRMDVTRNLNTDPVDKPNRDFSDIDISADHGEI